MGRSNAYTYAVDTLDAAGPGSYLSEGFLDASELGDLPLVLHSAIQATCERQLKTFMGGASLPRLRESRLIWTANLPSVAQWELGARWYSCEIGVLQEGSIFASRQLEEPASGIVSLLNDVRTSLPQFALCVDTVSNEFPPDSPDALIVACSDSRWTMNQISIEDNAVDFYPGDDAAAVIASSKCDAAFANSVKVVSMPLSEADWDAVQPSLGCWVSVKADDVPTPSPTSSVSSGDNNVTEQPHSSVPPVNTVGPDGSENSNTPQPSQ
ncbi:MAG: septum formation family protein [Microbacteriaceae bacterium]